MTLRKLLRYVTVSATSPGWANAIATGIGTIPSFELNRRWVWRKRGPRSLWAEVAPYCAVALSGLVLSTLAVTSASGWAVAAGWGVAARTFVAEAANVATFGALWVLQFALSDRVLFRTRPAAVSVPAP